MTTKPLPYERASDFAIGNCCATFACLRLWSKLTETADPIVRLCNSCESHVYLCVTLDELVAHVKAGNCVAVRVDAASEPHFVGKMEAPYMTGEKLIWDEQESPQKRAHTMDHPRAAS